VKKRKRPSPRYFAQQQALNETRKAANVLAHAIRLGKIPKVTETSRGECFGRSGECPVEGRRFTRHWFKPLSPLCVLCMTHELGLA
jgi:hypothetical protein